VFANTVVDGALQWREHPDPVPGRHELLVAVKSAGLNAADRVQIKGFYPAPPGSPPDILGLELAGEVVGTGDDVTDFAVGDRVMAVVGGGAQAELAVVHERHALPIPHALPWPQAGGFAETFTTAHDAVFTQAALGTGERICIHGAAGGVGTAAVQLAASVGAHVTATVRHHDHHDAVGGLGADVVLDPAEFVDGGPYDVILELVGAPNWPGNLEAIAPWGRVVVIGVGAGADIELNLFSLMAKRATLRGSTLRARPLEEKAAAAQLMRRHVLPHLAAGDLSVPITATYAMSDATAAYDQFTAGGKLGKIVLTAS
jgi:NADPH:quinone reductase-like Zn-dependent oxidoreductase